ncbi:CDC48 family AAA ATPase [Haloarcula nitratireducens]|uniref:CDC48 family AAA ATPase n=1 Tax=Haloarcula nitratireducens TaxID=2487749 RepID=A0AAW4PA12_9EURY|nr:CDC48 family AAA ATPase [Halomicroarcula nitratireducens]MBX0294592.1 CDC48 family AAA ATPase [Halomicroarcula nitratireducens]
MRLIVKPLDRQSAGKGIAAIDREAMAELGIENGDFVAIEGEKGATVVRVRQGQAGERQRGIVGIDGQTRKTIGARLDRLASVEEADVDPANRLSIALPDGLQIRGDLAPYLREKLANRAVRAGQTVPLSLGLGSVMGRSNRRIPIRIVETDPEGTVVITQSTDVEVAEQSAESVDDARDVEAADSPESPSVTYEDVGGLDDELDQVREMIELPMTHPELFQALGIEPPQGVLLHGPPGTGKTLIAKAVANEIDANFSTISGPEIMSKYHGESEERLREVFEEAGENEPSIIFIDEIDSIAPKRDDTQGEVERRVVAQLLSLMDGLEDRGQVTVIGTTNRVDSIDNALRRGGRFDREIEIGVPDTEGRHEVLQIHTREMPIADDVDLEQYADNTHGFVGADLESLVREAAMNALRRVRPDLDLEGDEISAETLETLEVTEKDLRSALREIDPSALREVFVEKPDVSWDDVGGLAETKERLQEAIEWPLAYPDAYKRVDLQSTKGILLHGPPGTGKTLLAKAVANEAQSNFISVKGPELFDKYVGESEKGVREIFEKARSNAPTVIFFDEIDAIASKRGSGGGDNQVGERVVSQLLTELDGLEELEDVVVIAATNRPDLIDDALTRAGRIERKIEVGAPDEETRREILTIHTRNRPLADDVDLDKIAAEMDGFVGADVAALCRGAATAAVREHVRSHASGEPTAVEEIVLTQAHFESALEEITADNE